jgi:hypothetical protein
VARFNEILVGRYNRFLQKLLSMKGSPPAPQLSSEIITSLNLFHGVENRYLEGWERFAAAVGPTGAAGQSAAIALRNPAGSNVVAVIEQIFMWAAATANVSIQRNVTADLGTVVSLTSNRIPDTRQRPSPTIIESTSTAGVTTGVTMFSVSLIANQVFALISDENQEFPISPGDGIQLIDNTLAQQLNVSFLWRERILEESERT